MGEPIAEVGYLAGVCGDDGTDWEKVGVSASGRLKVETEASDGTDLKDLLDKLDDCLTALQKIDDLQNALNSVATDELDVVLDGQNADVEVTQTTPADLRIAQHQYDGADWRKSNLLWGYNDRVVETVSELNATVGTNTISTTAVPANEVHVIQAVSAQNSTTNPSLIMLYAQCGTDTPRFKVEATPGVSVPSVWSGNVTLKEGDYVSAQFRDCASGDDLYLWILGYKMDIDM